VSNGTCVLAKAHVLPLVHDPPDVGEHLAPISPHNTLESVLEPFDRLLLIDAMTCADLALGSSSLGNTLTGSSPKYIPSVCRLAKNPVAFREQRTTHMQQ